MKTEQIRNIRQTGRNPERIRERHDPLASWDSGSYGLPATLTAGQKPYSVGIYARLSVDHHDQKTESIDSQISIAKTYLNTREDMALYDCYCDCGATGTNFARPGFERLMQDIRNGRVNCVMVKDFSRFGRNYIEAGNYIEHIFPVQGVRFVAVTDGYDSAAEADQMQRLTMHLKNITNELYAKDIAEKVTASKRLRMRQGSFVGSNAPYGYTIKNKDGRRILIPDEAAAVVKQIFERYDRGETLKGIIVHLYEQNIHRPADCRKYQMVYWQEGQVLTEWNRAALKVLLNNPAYCGHLLQKIQRDKANVVVEHTHEALVTEKQFRRVQKRLEENRQSTAPVQRAEKKANVLPAHRVEKKINAASVRSEEEKISWVSGEFADVLYCGACGHRLYRKRKRKTQMGKADRSYVFYQCPNRERIDKIRCDGGQIPQIMIQKISWEVFRKEMLLRGIEHSEAAVWRQEAVQERQSALQREERRLQKIQNTALLQASLYYQDYRNGRMSLSQFQMKQAELEQKQKQAGECLKELAEKHRPQEMRLEEAAELVHSLVRKIRVYSGKKMEVIWCFKAENYKSEE
jgi:DNA invertase Pin-like site-specific DNA recombinase